jgi:hypothetical protein
MHAEAKAYIAQTAAMLGVDTHAGIAYDIGGRETNGHARDVFPLAQWTVIDAVDGPGVDVVCDGVDFKPAVKAPLVLFAEVAEHTPRAREIIANIHTNVLEPYGVLVMTAAGPGRAPHGLYHDDPNQPGWYRNIEPQELDQWLLEAGFGYWHIDVAGDDVRAFAYA